MENMEPKNYKVLVPVDFSESSRMAVKYVLRTFYHQLSHLILLHAYKEASSEGAPMITLLDILREKSERQMQQELARVGGMSRPEKLEVVGYSRFDTLVEAIQELALASEIDLVVMGFQEPEHRRLMYFDNHATAILSQTNLPVLMVPKIAN